ncbi:MAG: MJ0042-type zinc finger domain-containing protein [Myxococcota bacterium]
MEITCPRCQTRHLIDFPATARARPARAPKFRCSHCGHTFAVDPAAPAPETPPAPVEPPRQGGPEIGTNAPPGELIQMLQSNGQIWPVPDMATLHRWILEGRVGRADLASNHGMRWQRIGDRGDLELFFTAADRMREAANRRDVLPFPPPSAREEDEVFVETGEAPPEEAARPGAVSFSTLIPPEPTEVADLPDTTQVHDPGAFARDHDTQEQTIHSVDDLRRGLPPIVPEAPEPTANLRGMRTVRPLDLPRLPTEEPEPTQELKQGRVRPPAPPIAPPDPMFSDLEQGFQSSSPRVAGDVFDDPPPQSSPNRGMWLFIGGIGSLAIAVLIAAVVVVVAKSEPAPAADGKAVVEGAATTPVAVAPVDPAKPQPAKDDAADKAAAEKAAAEKAAAEKAAAEKAAAQPKPPSTGGGGSSATSLVSQGWKAVEAGDMLKAHGLFDRALQKKPGNASALYGRGYANEKMGDTVSAGSDYCEAMANGPDADTSRELNAGLRRVGRGC